MKERLLEKIPTERRSFVKKLVATSVFAAPVIKSFSMKEVKAESIYTPKVSF